MPWGRSRVTSGRSITMLVSVERNSRKSLTLAPAISSPSGAPLPSHRSERFPPFGPISGIGAGRLASQRGFSHQPVAGKPLPVDPPKLVVGEQFLPPERLEHTHPRPLLEAPMRRAGRADPSRIQRVPL